MARFYVVELHDMGSLSRYIMRLRRKFCGALVTILELIDHSSRLAVVCVEGDLDSYQCLCRFSCGSCWIKLILHCVYERRLVLILIDAKY